MLESEIPAVTTTVATTVAIATAAATAFAVTAAATTAAAAEASFLEATAAAALGFGLGFVHDDLATHYFAFVQAAQRILCFSVFRHFNETEAFAAAAYFVLNDLGRSHRAILLKQTSQILIGHLPGEVPYVNVHCQKSFKCSEKLIRTIVTAMN